MSRISDYQEYLKSERWLTLSDAVKARAEYRCQLCDSGGELHAHHRAYYRVETDKEILDLVCLCKKCHERAHGINVDCQTPAGKINYIANPYVSLEFKCPLCQCLYPSKEQSDTCWCKRK